MSKTIKAPAGNAAGRDILSTGAPTVHVQAITGGTNIIGNQGDINILFEAARPARRQVIVQPGPQHISEEQKSTLKTLCDEWVALHATLKKRPLTYGAAWSRINKAAGTTSYSLILKERFTDAVELIQREMAVLRSMRSAPSKDDTWRTKRIGAIKARCKNQLGDPDFYKPYIKKNFKADSLTELATDELQRTYAYVMAKRG
ncbi:MAG: hypothetical protein ACK561_09930 [Pseudomonadaceae bacterium]